MLSIALAGGVWGSGATLLVLNTFTTELFPTDLRSEAFAWSNNLIARSIYLVSPLAVGLAAEEVGWGPAVAATAVFPLVALGMILTTLPETAGKELEETPRSEASATARGSGDAHSGAMIDEKPSIRDRIELARYAIRTGLVSADEAG